MSRMNGKKTHTLCNLINTHTHKHCIAPIQNGFSCEVHIRLVFIHTKCTISNNEVFRYSTKLVQEKFSPRSFPAERSPHLLNILVVSAVQWLSALAGKTPILRLIKALLIIVYYCRKLLCSLLCVKKRNNTI